MVRDGGREESHRARAPDTAGAARAAARAARAALVAVAAARAVAAAAAANRGCLLQQAFHCLEQRQPVVAGPPAAMMQAYPTGAGAPNGTNGTTASLPLSGPHIPTAFDCPPPTSNPPLCAPASLLLCVAASLRTLTSLASLASPPSPPSPPRTPRGLPPPTPTSLSAGLARRPPSFSSLPTPYSPRSRLPPRA